MDCLLQQLPKLEYVMNNLKFLEIGIIISFESIKTELTFGIRQFNERSIQKLFFYLSSIKKTYKYTNIRIIVRCGKHIGMRY